MQALVMDFLIVEIYTFSTHKISQARFRSGKPVLSLPFYAIESSTNLQIIDKGRESQSKE
jgi:hypothetical protein